MHSTGVRAAVSGGILNRHPELVSIINAAAFINQCEDSDTTREITNFIADALDWANPSTDDPRSVISRGVIDLVSGVDARPLNRLDDFYREINCWNALIASEKDDAARQGIETKLAAAAIAAEVAAAAAAAAQQQMEQLAGGRRVGKKRREIPEELMEAARGALFLTERAFGWFEEPRDDDDDDDTHGGGGAVASGERAGDIAVGDDECAGKKKTAPPPPPTSSGGKPIAGAADIEAEEDACEGKKKTIASGGKSIAGAAESATMTFEEMGKLLNKGRGGVFKL